MSRKQKQKHLKDEFEKYRKGTVAPLLEKNKDMFSTDDSGKLLSKNIECIMDNVPFI